MRLPFILASIRRVKIRLERLRDHLRGTLWFVPGLFVAASIALAFGLAAFDRRLDVPDATLLFTGSADSARSVLSTIAASMITLVSLVFTITIVVLQLASSQFSPRVLRTFLRDRDSQTALGVFVGTFAFAFTLLREVRSVPEFVPRVGVTLAFLLVLLSLAVFIRYINHIAHSIRASSLIRSIAEETRVLIERDYPEDGSHTSPPSEDPRSGTGRVVAAPEPGVLTGFDPDALVRRAESAKCTLVLLPALGDFVPEGAPLFEVYGDDEDLDNLGRHVNLEVERTMRHDLGFGLRQIIDIAERALSPGVNDPTTAVQVIDQLHDLLRRLASRRFPPDAYHDDDGHLRLLVPRPTWEDYLNLSVDEIRQYGAGSIQVARRLRAMLCDLRDVAPADRRGGVDRQLELLDAMVERSFPDVADRVRGGQADEQGIGS